ncbi:uncharacterized protein LOC21407016 [Morus notabilis]|uniref:uncharacterized protein LOC21407016 n=1 Tax=Morus notabilis TaxID=981085 RepID=UPI000CED35F3|nr:uncharacterized protein LOC21407016 [Morus notabilis]XP_024031456.1 uncharacterized protein LOC21407016 [Morus notabilis]
MARLTPPKSPMVCDKHKSGCLWSMYSLFEFRHGNSNRKLLSDHRKRLKRSDVVDDGDVKQNDLLTKFDEKFQGKDNSNENLVCPDIQHENKPKREEASTSELGQLPKKFQRPSHGQTDSAKQKQPPYPKPAGKSFDKLKSAASEQTPHKKKHAKKRRGCGCKNVDFVRYGQLNEINPQLLKVNDATEAIVNRKFIEGKYLSGDGVSQHSKQLLDALEILNSNKGLFSKLLQDPNSLLVKHIEDLRDSQTQKQQTKSSSESNISEHQTSNHRLHEEPGSTKIFIDSNKCHSKGRSDLQSSEIVLLKPGPIGLRNSADKINISHCSSPQSFHSFEEDLQSVRPTYFSFDHIKRKFRHAMGVTRKDQHLMSNDGVKQCSPNKRMEIIRRNSHNTIHVQKEKMEKASFDIHRREKINKLKDFKARIGHETASTSESGRNRSESRAYVESINEDDKFLHKQGPKVFQRTVSYPEHDFLPLHSPWRDTETGFVSGQMRFSPYSYSQVPYENNNWALQKEHKISYSSSLKQNLEAIIDSKKSKSQLPVFDPSIGGETKTMEFPFKLDGREKNDTTETTDTRDSEEASTSSHSLVKISTVETSDSACQDATDLSEDGSCDTDKGSTNQNTNATYTNGEDEYLKRSRLDSSFEDQPSTCSNDVFPSTPRVQRVEDPDSIKDIGDQSSPISVLEQFFTDVSSPPSTICQSAEGQKSHLDPNVNSTTLFVYGYISEYVKAVLQASGLNWDKLDFKSRKSHHLLDPSLLNSVKLQDNQFCGDCELLFDCISEVLPEVYDGNFRSSPWLSFIKPKCLQPVQVEKFVIREVTRRVDCYLRPESLPRTLDQLIGNDLRRSGTWLDIRTDVEDLVSEMVESALDELIMETIVDLQL